MTSHGIPEHASIVFTTPATHLPGLVHEEMVGHHGRHHRQHAVVKVGDLEAIRHSLQLSHLVALTHLLMATQKPKVKKTVQFICLLLGECKIYTPDQVPVVYKTKARNRMLH